MRKNNSYKKVLCNKPHKIWTREEWMQAIEESHAAIMKAGEAIINLAKLYKNTPKTNNRKKTK